MGGRASLQKWRHRENAIRAGAAWQDLDHRRQLVRREQKADSCGRAASRRAAPKKVAGHVFVFFGRRRWPSSRRRSSEKEASPTRLEEHTEHAVAISSILKPKEPVPAEDYCYETGGVSRVCGRPAGRRRRAPSRTPRARPPSWRSAPQRHATHETTTIMPKPLGAESPRSGTLSPAASYSGSRPGMREQAGRPRRRLLRGSAGASGVDEREPTAEPDSL